MTERLSLHRTDRRAAWRFATALAAIVLLGAVLRVAFPLADPPWHSPVGVVWHDEGAWVHNARNRVLFGEWSLDAWNPMYITPVLTGLEAASFATFGVGLWQARLVSEVAGVCSVLLLGLGVARIAGRRTGLVAAGLLATSVVAIMYDRAALMEASMVAWMVIAWYGYVRAGSAPSWGLVAGAAATLAYFTKASAVCFVAALGFDALLSVVEPWWLARRSRDVRPAGAPPARIGVGPEGRAGAWTLGGLALAVAVGLAVFVIPSWSDYRFYNWQMSVTRKPLYSVGALVDRVTWYPIVHDFFTRIWLPTGLAVGSALSLACRWRRVAPAERLLVWWVAFGTLELLLHDVGNERRFVFLLPSLMALAALAIARDRRWLDEGVGRITRGHALLLWPVAAYALYLVIGAGVRIAFLGEIHAGRFSSVVRWSAGLAGVLAAGAVIGWPSVTARLARVRWSARWAVLLTAVLTCCNLWQYAEWAARRTYRNYDAMLAVARWLPPGTLVHGKLSNGLALESRIRPVFVGREFGNYADATARHDIRHLLTYVRPCLGYEGPVIQEVLAAAPGWTILQEVDVAESATGHDRAALIDKYPRDRLRSGTMPRREETIPLCGR